MRRMSLTHGRGFSIQNRRTGTLGFVKSIVDDEDAQAGERLSNFTEHEIGALFRLRDSSACSSRRLFLQSEGKITTAMRKSANLAWRKLEIHQKSSGTVLIIYQISSVEV